MNRPLPADWRELSRLDEVVHFGRIDGLMVTFNPAATRFDEDGWIHLCVSRQGRFPTWDEILLAKKLFIGDEREAFHVIPPTRRDERYRPAVIHLWARAT